MEWWGLGEQRGGVKGTRRTEGWSGGDWGSRGWSGEDWGNRGVEWRGLGEQRDGVEMIVGHFYELLGSVINAKWQK